MDISKIKVRFGRKSPKRLGRGTGSGTGKTSGRGNKGGGSRSGKVLPYVGFSGGNLPYIRRLPKRGFHNPFAVEYQEVNLRDIQQRLKKESTINAEVLEKAGLIKDANKPVKILASVNEALTIKAVFTADKFSQKALKLIGDAGGTANCKTPQSK